MNNDGKNGKNAGDGGHSSTDSPDSNSSHSSHPPGPIIPPRGHYQTLLSFQKAEVVYDLPGHCTLPNFFSNSR